MPRQKSRKTEAQAKKLSAKKSSRGQGARSPKQEAEARDDKNRRRFQSPPGLLAQDLPDGGRDSVETDVNKERKRNTPNFTGGTYTSRGGYSDAGARGRMNSTAADKHGGRKRN